MNYREIVDYIEEIPKFTSKNPLDHTKALLKCLGDPQNQMQVIHVAGTNGKGSVCAYLDSMLRAGGYKVGLFTSPHLVKINERFKINGEMISDAIGIQNPGIDLFCKRDIPYLKQFDTKIIVNVCGRSTEDY